MSPGQLPTPSGCRSDFRPHSPPTRSRALILPATFAALQLRNSLACLWNFENRTCAPPGGLAKSRSTSYASAMFRLPTQRARATRPYPSPAEEICLGFACRMCQITHKLDQKQRGVGGREGGREGGRMDRDRDRKKGDAAAEACRPMGDAPCAGSRRQGVQISCASVREGLILSHQVLPPQFPHNLPDFTTPPPGCLPDCDFSRVRG